MRAFASLVARHAPGQPLAGFHVFGVQHLLGSTGPLLRALASSGVPPSRITVLGKPYSQHAGVMSELRQEGFNVLESQRRTSEQVPRLAQGVIDTLLADPAAKVLLVDDGGDLIRRVLELINQSGVPRGLGKRIVAVEQTSAGLAMVKATHTVFGIAATQGSTTHESFTTMKVADSWGKVKKETPLIGRSVTQSVLEKLAELRGRGVPGLDPQAGPVRVLLVGYGKIGRATTLELRRQGYEVAMADRGDALPRTLGAPPPRWVQQAIRRDRILYFRSARAGVRSYRPQVVVTASGRECLGLDDLGWVAHTPGRRLVVLNAASEWSDFPQLQALAARLEASGRAPRTFAGVPLTPNRLLPARSDQVIPAPGGGEVLLADGGAPLNLAKIVRREVRGEGGQLHVVEEQVADPIPSRYIQLTRGLLYLAAVQGARLLQKGTARELAALPLREQRRFVHDIQAELRGSGLASLGDARF